MLFFSFQYYISDRGVCASQGYLQSLSQSKEDNHSYCSFVQAVVVITENYRTTLYRDPDSRHVVEVIVEAHQHPVLAGHSQV